MHNTYSTYLDTLKFVFEHHPRQERELAGVLSDIRVESGSRDASLNRIVERVEVLMI